LNRFLAAADELSIKGLTSDNDLQKHSSTYTNSAEEDHDSVTDANTTLGQRRKGKKPNLKRERIYVDDFDEEQKVNFSP